MGGGGSSSSSSGKEHVQLPPDAERVEVELGPRQDGQVVVRSGIAAGDVIVTSGNLKLFPGIAVQIREPAKDVAASTEPN